MSIAVSPARSLDSLIPDFVGEWVRAAAAFPGREAVRYVDAFGGAEFTFGQPARSGKRSAAAALAAAESGAVAVLIEEDPGLVTRLRGALCDLGAVERLHPVLEDAPAGSIVLLQADFLDVVDALAAAAPETAILIWMAPTSARRLPWRVLSALLEDPSLEMLLRFPASDFLKQDSRRDPLADLPSFTRRVVDGCSALLGDGRHEWLARWRRESATLGPSVALDAVTDRFSAQLGAACGDRLLKRLDVGADPPQPLYLVTSAPEAALALNGAVAAHEPPPPVAQGYDLFGAPSVVADLEPNPASSLAEQLWQSHRGRSATLRDLAGELASTDATLQQLRTALLRLRRSGRAEFGSLRSTETLVSFPIEPASRPPRVSHRASCEMDLFAVQT
jgi:hypothetical protein